MFAEELKGNASRKRQEEARARRRQIKHQQQQKKKTSQISSTSVRASSPEQSSTIATVRSISSLPQPLSGVQSSSNSAETTTTKPSAVAAALAQRQLRHEQQTKQKAALIIQSSYRAYRSNCRLIDEQVSLLSQRLKDLETLRTLIVQKTNKEYVPPPATITVLVRQLLFVTRSIPYERIDDIQMHTMLRSPTDDAWRLQKVLRYVLLPGIVGTDDNLDPILTWIDERVGRFRLMELLRLCFVSLTYKPPVVPTEVLTTIDSFLQTVMGVSASTATARVAIMNQCRVVIPMKYSSYPPPIDKKTKRSPPYAVTGSSLDIIQILRYQLLFGSGHPIPNDAEKRREACIARTLREQNDVLFQLCLSSVQAARTGPERRRLQSRFLSEILTVPLLTWKVSVAIVSMFLAPSRQSSSPVIMELLESFVEQNAAALSTGKVADVLPSFGVPMTSCPATPTQCLLASLVQIGRLCPSINGSDAMKTNYKDGALFFRFLATLIDTVPLGTFSSRESAVEWISDGKSHHTPIVLSSVVIEQCKLVLVDSFVRNLFNSAIDNDALRTREILRTKNDKDLKHEKDLAEVGTSSATSLAANEARVDRSKSFWQSSKWARKLSSSVSKILTKEDNAGSRRSASSLGKDGGQGMLMDTSSMSRKLAHGKDLHDRSVTNAILAGDEVNQKASIADLRTTTFKAAYSPEFLFALCRAYGAFLARWGGGGQGDIVAGVGWESATSIRESEERKAQATATADPLTRSILNVICFSTPFVETSWALTQSHARVISDLYAVIDTNRSSSPIRSMTVRPTYRYPTSSDASRNVGNTDGAAVLFLSVSCLSHALIITDDVEIDEMEKPIPIHQLRRCIQLLKKLLYRACCVDERNDASDSNYFGLALISSSSKTMRDLYDRSSRRPLCVPKGWLIDGLLDKELKQCKTAGQYTALLANPVLRVCPFLVSFKRRLKLFERIVTLTRIEIQGINDQNPFSSQGLKPGIPVRIMRTRLLEDGLATMNNLGSNMRQRIVVQYTNEAGRQESGVDVGGLFKEFWTGLCQLAFDPNYALFRVTEGNCLYPNPSSFAAHGTDHIVLFEFLGRILGKALFEGITIHPQFAHFFLSFLRGDYNFLHQFSDLSTMDAQLYDNLMFLKTYDGDAEDLCLTFTVANDDFGDNTEIPLIPNGADISVTNANKHRYIGLVAKHHVCDRVKEQSEAFRRGMWEVIDRSWLRIFNEPELQVLISGPSDGKIDIDDMRSNSRYAGGYTPIDRNIRGFWNVVASLSPKQQADLLRFVTSCERPPPLGFSTLNPPFTIQRVGILRDGDMLPSASTCFNTLKLPTYSSEKVLRQRLVYAIESGAGFELT